MGISKMVVYINLLEFSCLIKILIIEEGAFEKISDSLGFIVVDLWRLYWLQ